MQYFELKDIVFSPNSKMDKFGRVFFKDNKVYRGIYKESKEICLELFNTGLIDELQEKKLIPKTVITDIQVEGFELVLEHEKVISSQPSEWIFSMFKNAALMTLEVNNVCNKYGYQLKDGHPWNISFCNNNPVFLDIGSIENYEKKLAKSFRKQFKLTFMHPLILWSMNEDYIAQNCISSPSNIHKRTLPNSKLHKSKAINFIFILFGIKTLFSKIKILLSLLLKGKSINENFDKEFIKYINLPKSIKTVWNNYHEDIFNDESNLNTRFLRFKKIKEYIDLYASDSNSILDLAGNMGGMLYYLEKNNTKLKKFINTDYDEAAIENAYKKLKELNSTIEVYPLNFMLPKRNDICEDIKSDIVLALAITHHLILTQDYHLQTIFDRIKSYSNKYVFIEFMPLGLWAGDDNKTLALPEWYNVNWFRDSFKKDFELLHEEQLEKNRILFVGKKK